MVTISKNEADAPHSFFLISLNAIEGKTRVLRLPSVCILSNSGQDKIILKERFEKSGASACAKAISQYFNINVSRYIAFTDQSFISFIDLFNPTESDILEDLNETDRKNDIYIKIDKGRRLLGGFMMLDIFAYTKWEGGACAGLFESSRVLCDFLSQNGREILKAQNFILANARTNLSALDFENHRELISYMFSLPDANESIKIYGEYQLEETQFVLWSSSKTKIAALF